MWADLIFWIAISLLLLYVFLNIMTAASLKHLDQPDLFKPLIRDKIRKPKWKETDEPLDKWAQNKGFEWDVCLEFSGIAGDELFIINTWIHPTQFTYLISYFHPSQTWFEFITPFGSDKSLSSSNSKDAMTIPQPPGYYHESFHGCDIDTLYQKHKGSALFLVNTQKCIPSKPLMSTQRLMEKAIRKQLDYVYAIPQWYLEGAGWYLFRRNYLNGKNIQRQLGSKNT